MPSLNFQQRFAPLVQSGQKRQSIRNGKRWKVGDIAHCFTGLRSKACRKLGAWPVTDVQDFLIKRYDLGLGFYIDGLGLISDDVEAIALADGFAQVWDFQDFFATTYGLPFDGQIITWDWDRPL